MKAQAAQQDAWLEKLGVNLDRANLLDEDADFSPGADSAGAADSKNLFFTPAPGGQPTPPVGGGTTKPAKAAPSADEIRAAQQAINKWRVANGDTAISVTGVLDSDTNSAIAEFQHDTGLDPFQLDSAEAKETMSVLLDILKLNPNSLGSDKFSEFTGSDGFRSLPKTVQTKLLKRIKAYAGGTGTLDNIRLVKEVVKEPGFEKLPTTSQRLVLNIWGARADDQDLASNLRQLVGSAEFQKIPEKTQTLVLNRMKKYGGDRKKVDNLENLITTTMHFDELSQENQMQLLNELAANPEDAELVDSLGIAVNGDLNLAAQNVDFRAMGPDMQKEVLDRIPNYPRTKLNVENLMVLSARSDFANLDPDIRDQILKELPYPYQDVPLDSTMMTNLMNLVTASGFDKLPADTRQLLIGTLSARPGNVNLANALLQLVTSGQLWDKRTARKKVLDVDDQTP